MRYCCSLGCNNSGKSETYSRGISFHRFPKVDSVRQQWILRLRLQDPATGSVWEPTNNSVICSEHFKPDDFEIKGNKRHLKPNSIPSIFSSTRLSASKKLPLPMPSVGVSVSVGASASGGASSSGGVSAFARAAASVGASALEENVDIVEEPLHMGVEFEVVIQTTMVVPESHAQETESVAASVSSISVDPSDLTVGAEEECSICTTPASKRRLFRVRARRKRSKVLSTEAENLIGEHTYSVITPRKWKRSTSFLSNQLERRKQVMQNARRKINRLQGKISDLLEKIKQQAQITTQASDLLQAYKAIPMNLFRTDEDRPYTDEQKKFASTLYYYSPAAFGFARKHLPVPHPRTVQRWLSRYDSQPGVTEPSFDLIKSKVDQGDDAYRLCCVHMDEMEIKRHLEYDRHTEKVHGFIDFGLGPLDDDSQPQATKVLAIVAVGLLGRWKLPLAYVFTDGTNAELQASLLTDIITRLWEAGSMAVSVTFDGLAANLKTVQLLGGSANVDSLNPKFPHPNVSGVFVCVVLDACHMVKLVRNLLCEYQIVEVPGYGQAKWQHIELLLKKQEEEGLTLANKLTKQHIEFKQQIMKVRLAVQVLSSSVAQGLCYLRENGNREFLDNQATQKLIEVVDELFDLLNSRSIRAKGLKKPITAYNAPIYIGKMKAAREFLLSLKGSDGKRLVETRRRTCIIGLAMTIDSVIHLAESVLLNPLGSNGVHLRYLLTHRLSQDHIETFFSVIRRRGGWNNNPTALQFTRIYHSHLCHLDVAPSGRGNITLLPEDETENELLSDGEVDNILEDDSSVCSAIVEADLPRLSNFVDNVVEYIAGFIVRKLISRLQCTTCRMLPVAPADSTSCAFLELRDKGGLVRASTDVVYIVKIAEKIFRAHISAEAPGHDISRLKHKLTVMIVESINYNNIFTTTTHAVDTCVGMDNHVFALVKLIVKFYVDIRKFHVLKHHNIKKVGVSVRQKCTKLVHFKNQ